LQGIWMISFIGWRRRLAKGAVAVSAPEGPPAG